MFHSNNINGHVLGKIEISVCTFGLVGKINKITFYLTYYKHYDVYFHLSFRTHNSRLFYKTIHYVFNLKYSAVVRKYSVVKTQLRI